MHRNVLALYALLLSSFAFAEAPSISPPVEATFGASVDSVRGALSERCRTIAVRELDPAELPVAELSHTQIDCGGFRHAGAERLAEFVFADDRLVFVWVLTQAEEEAQLLAALVERYGEPSHRADDFHAFVAHHVALRRDRPELLYYAPAVAPLYEAWFAAAVAD